MLCRYLLVEDIKQKINEIKHPVIKALTIFSIKLKLIDSNENGIINKGNLVSKSLNPKDKLEEYINPER